MPHSIYVYPIEDLIAQINRGHQTRIELHASWQYPIWSNGGSSLLFRLRDQSGDRDRIMELSVAMSDFRVTAGPRQLTEAAISRILTQIQSFFTDSCGQGENPRSNSLLKMYARGT